MEVTSSIVNLSEYNKQGSAIVHRLHVHITDPEARIADMIRNISDMTWVSKLDIYAQTSYQAALDETIPLILNMLKSYAIENEITKDIGEYLVSDSACESLHQSYNHIRLPLSELWKEKKSGNPGFDFHTVSIQNHVIFGEAKYRTNSNPHTEALRQTSRFFNNKKHEKDVIHIKAIAGEEPANKIISGEFGCAVAFSVHGDNIDNIIDFALRCEHIDPLLNYKEVYVIGVEIC